MGARLVQITMKAHDDATLGAFWAEVLGWEVSSEGPGVTNLEPANFGYPDPAAACVDLIKSAEPKVGKNRVHVDLATTSAGHHAELVAKVLGLGAKRVDVGQGDVSWTVLADPEGNEFCVLDWRDPTPGTGPIASVAVDCADPEAMARFYSEAMGWTVHKTNDQSAALRSAAGVGPYLQFLRTPDAKNGWNRVHLDLRPYPEDDLEVEAGRLRKLGATDIDLDDSDIRWKVLADPEGNEFCLLTPG
ncbi:VOC family protein [Actinoplanes sp. TFC3]|uniref:VOC family protein n=1 Tax=Actinoplanes sp. TFC3 TaxID=1710355 RepID=UPI00082BD211|nr:VOC family protein [Actinoplanes sp. TFC3]